MRDRYIHRDLICERPMEGGLIGVLPSRFHELNQSLHSVLYTFINQFAYNLQVNGLYVLPPLKNQFAYNLQKKKKKIKVTFTLFAI